MTTTEDIIRLKDAEIWSLRKEVRELTIANAKMQIQLNNYKTIKNG